MILMSLSLSYQELEIVLHNSHIKFVTAKIGSLLDVQASKDPEGSNITNHHYYCYDN